ncbi:hypothetical protein AB1046_22345 [Promicromonospora sp. Populi]|uniref:hypothetical protein n=1 Tax=Promicromonospora sp. Populi TaxID=3239420 RepID=UPI0034E20388
MSSITSTPTERTAVAPDAWIAGNSHLISMVMAMENADFATRASSAEGSEEKRWTVDGTTLAFARFGSGQIETDVFSKVVDGKVTLINPTYRKQFRRSSGTPFVSPERLWGFCNINNNSRIFRRPMWQKHAPTHLAHPGASPVSYDVVRAIVERDHHGVRVFFKQLQQVGVEFFAISAPGPRRDHPAARTQYGRDLALYIDALSRELWHEWLDGRGIAVIEPPAQTIDDDGFLREDLYHVRATDPPDVSHGNAVYGHLVVAEVTQHVNTARKAV